MTTAAIDVARYLGRLVDHRDDAGHLDLGKTRKALLMRDVDECGMIAHIMIFQYLVTSFNRAAD
jgi:hypothetical protein